MACKYLLMTVYYPAFINLNGKNCVVVGGGKVAERKILSLIRCGAKVKVISPVITDTLEKYKTKKQIKHIKRKYRKGDLKNAFLVIAATSDKETNKRVSDEADCLINAVDMPEMANFIVPSVINRGMMTIAISTSGASPAMAKAVRKEIEMLYNKDFGKFLAFLKKLRARAIKEISDKKTRERFFKNLTSKEIIKTLREKGFEKAKEMITNNIQGVKA
jgi:precorrin-2 dehydrogenase/sirohydrochlorin ferrochelatase